MPMILKKYQRQLKAEFDSLGCGDQGFTLEPIQTDGLVSGFVIKFLGSQFTFTITKDNSERQDQFYGKFTGYFPPDFKERDVGNFVYPHDFQNRIRYWIEQHINVYLEEMESDTIKLAPRPNISNKNKRPLFSELISQSLSRRSGNNKTEKSNAEILYKVGKILIWILGVLASVATILQLAMMS